MIEVSSISRTQNELDFSPSHGTQIPVLAEHKASLHHPSQDHILEKDTKYNENMVQ